MKNTQPEPEPSATPEDPEVQASSDLEDDLPEAEIVEEPELTPEEQLRNERDEYHDSWRRTQADIQNLRRRQAEVIDTAVRGARRELFSELLLVLDFLDMALLTPVETQEGKNLQAGVQMTRDQMLQLLGQHEIEAIDSTGSFDPEVHEAVETIETDEHPAGTIVSTLRSGYRAGKDILRYAQVRVAAEPAAESADEAAPEQSEG